MTERLPILANPRSERIRSIAALGGRSYRRRKAQLRVEGPQAVRELLEFRRDHVQALYATPAAAKTYPNLWSAGAGLTPRIPRFLVENEVAQKTVPDAQGIFAVADLAAIPSGTVENASRGVIAVLVRLQDPGNVGTLIRAADAFGAAGVVLTSGCADVTSPKVIRSSAGSIFHLPVVAGADVAQVAAELRENGHTILGTDGHPSAIPLQDVDLSGPHAWLFGNEASGLLEEEQALCDKLVRVNMTGPAESLNVATAAGICLYSSQQSR